MMHCRTVLPQPGAGRFGARFVNPAPVGEGASQNKQHAAAIAVSLVLLGSIYGCGESVDTRNVTGTVTMDGEPLANASVAFDPAAGGRPAYGVTNEAGEYELIFSRSAEGATPGEYVVRISTFVETVDENDETVRTPETVPVKYNVDTELKATVGEGPNVFPFELTSEGEKFQPVE